MAPTNSSYFLLLAHEMNFHAASFFVLACSMDQYHAYSQPELFVNTTGAAA